MKLSYLEGGDARDVGPIADAQPWRAWLRSLLGLDDLDREIQQRRMTTGGREAARTSLQDRRPDRESEGKWWGGESEVG